MAEVTPDSLLAHWFRPNQPQAAAEQQVAEIFSRLERWGAHRPSGIDWTMTTTEPRPPATFGAAFELASDAVMYAVEQVGITREALAPEDRRLAYILDRVLRMSNAWRIASERGLEVLGATWPPRAVRDRPFSELPDPFAAILELWQMGYLIEAEFSDEAPRVRLFAPSA